MKHTIFVGAMLLTAAAFAADINYADAKLWGNRNVTNPEANVLQVQGPTYVVAKTDKIKIDPAAKYRLTAEVRKAPGAKSPLFIAGFQLFDKDGKEIKTVDIRVIRGTATVLAADAKAGDKTIKVKNAVRWPKNASVAFNVGKLPNRDHVGYTTAEKSGSEWIVNLRTPLKKDYKANTKVWVQSAGAHFTFMSTNKLTDNWQKITSNTIQGIYGATEDFGNIKKFWPGAVSYKLLLMPNWGWGAGNKEFKSQIRNIKIEITK